MKKEKNKVGRPKLADNEIKKKAVLMVLTSIVLAVFMLTGFVFYTNINLFNLKGVTTTTKNQKISECSTGECPKPSKTNSMNQIKSCEEGNDIGFETRINNCKNNPNSGKDFTLLLHKNVVDLDGKIMQNFEVTDKYIYASYKATVYKNQKNQNSKIKNNPTPIPFEKGDSVTKYVKDNYAASSTTTIKRVDKKGDAKYVVLENAGHSQNFDIVTINGKDYVYTNSKPFYYNEDLPVASSAFQILEFSKNINGTSGSKGRKVLYKTEKNVTSSYSYYFVIGEYENNNKLTKEYKLIREDKYKQQINKYKSVKKTNIQVAVDEVNKLIAVHAYKIKKVFIFKMRTNKSGLLSENINEQLETVSSPIHIIDLCNKDKSYSCLRGEGNQGIAFHDNRIYIAAGGDDLNEETGSIKYYQIPTVVRIELKKDKDNNYESNIKSISFNIRNALQSFCKENNKKCDLNKRLCFSDKKKIAIEVEGISASSGGVYLGVVFKQYAKDDCNEKGKIVTKGGKRFNYIYRLTHISQQSNDN